MRGIGKAAFALGAAVTVICAVTALVCGALIALRGYDLGGLTDGGNAAFYAVGERTDDVSTLIGEVREAGGAGVAADGDLVITAVYADGSDAETVAERTGREVFELTYSPEPETADVAEAVRETEELWRAAEAGSVSESYALTRMTAIAEALLSGACAEAGAAVLAAADGTPAACALRRASAQLAVMLHEGRFSV